MHGSPVVGALTLRLVVAIMTPEQQKRIHELLDEHLLLAARHGFDVPRLLGQLALSQALVFSYKFDGSPQA